MLDTAGGVGGSVGGLSQREVSPAVDRDAGALRPVIGQRRVNDISTADVLRILTPIWSGENATPVTAKLVKQRIATVLDWAKGHLHRSGDNLAEGVEAVLGKQSRSGKHHEALDYEQLPELVAKLRKASGYAMAKLALEYVVLTAGRLGEVTGARLDEIEGNVWTVPGNRMKAGKPHAVPLSPAALRVLEQARAHGEKISPGSLFVFPSSRAGKPVSPSAVHVLVKETSGNGATVHGMRTSFRNWCAERTNTPREIAEQALAHHVGNAVEQAYRRTDLLEKRRRLMDKWAAFVTEGTREVVNIADRRTA